MDEVLSKISKLITSKMSLPIMRLRDKGDTSLKKMKFSKRDSELLKLLHKVEISNVLNSWKVHLGWLIRVFRRPTNIHKNLCILSMNTTEEQMHASLTHLSTKSTVLPLNRYVIGSRKP